jgi:Transposase DDE domain
MARGGQMVDATIVPVPTQRNRRDENEAVKVGRIPQEWYHKPAKLCQKDRDTRWMKRHGRSFFRIQEARECGCQHKLIRRYEVTDAAVHDSQKLDELLTKGNTSADVFGDSAYRSSEIEDCAPAAASRAVFMCGPLASARCRKRKRMRTTTEAKFAPASSTCSQLNRPRWAAGSYARSHRASARQNWLAEPGIQHSPPCDAGADRRRMRVVRVWKARGGQIKGRRAGGNHTLQTIDPP